MITVTGDEVTTHLDALQQAVCQAEKAVTAEKLHFSVCSIQGEWSGEEVAGLIEDMKWLLQQQLPQSINHSFMCEEEAFFNTDDRRQGTLHSCVLDLLFASLQLIFCL